MNKCIFVQKYLFPCFPSHKTKTLIFSVDFVLALDAQVIIVGNVADQVKFSELTLDMFRMLQTLEREPQDEMAQVKPISVISWA